MKLGASGLEVRAQRPCPRLWLASYLDDLLTRDAAVLDAHKDPAKLRRYLHAMALNIAGMPTDATLYQAANVDAKTAAGYEQLLETSTSSPKSLHGAATG